MPTYTLPEKAELERQLTSLESTFSGFHAKRDVTGVWNRLVSLDNPEVIPPALAVDQDGIDWQSPDPQKFIQDHISVLHLNDPTFDMQVHGEGQKYRTNEREQLLVKATWWNTEVNAGKRATARWAEGMIRHGVKVDWLRPKPLHEHMTCPNYFQNTILDGNFWMDFDDDNKGPSAHWYRYSVPLVDANIKNGKGEKYSLDSYGQGCWMGSDEPIDYETIRDKSVDVYVRDAEDLAGKICPLEGCYHVQRVITIYVCPKGEKFKDKAETVETFPSPFPGSSFFIIGAHTFQTERDPDRIYQPHLMKPVYVTQAWLNMLTTMWAVLAINESSTRDLYGNSSQARPENLQSLDLREGGPTDTVKVPETGPNGEIPVMPFSIERLPKVTSVQLQSLIKMAMEKMDTYAPNRFQVGVNYTELSNGTMGANLQALQQSGILYNPMLAAMARAINKWDAYTDHQIKFNAYFNGEDIKYYASVTDDESLARYRSTIKRGEQLYLDEGKCLPHDLIVSISGKTIAEKQADWYLAHSQYMAGVLTEEDLIKKAGIFDVIGQMERLFKGKVRRSLEPMMVRMLDLKLVREASLQTGTDWGQLMQQVQPQQPRMEEAGVPSTQAANTARSLAPPPSLPAVGSPSGSAGGA